MSDFLTIFFKLQVALKLFRMQFYTMYFFLKRKKRLLLTLTVTMWCKFVFIMFIACFQIPLYYGNLLSPLQGKNNLPFRKFFLFFAQKLENRCPPKLWSGNKVVLLVFFLIQIAFKDSEGWGCPGVRTTLSHRHDWVFFNLKRLLGI